MIWLNDQISKAPQRCMVSGEAFEFYGIMPPIVVDPETALLTPTQQRILDHLTANADRCVSGFELRDEIIPGRDEGGIRVQVHHMRQKGANIESRSGPNGGYRVASPHSETVSIFRLGGV